MAVSWSAQHADALFQKNYSAAGSAFGAQRGPCSTHGALSKLLRRTKLDRARNFYGDPPKIPSSGISSRRYSPSLSFVVRGADKAIRRNPDQPPNRNRHYASHPGHGPQMPPGSKTMGTFRVPSTRRWPGGDIPGAGRQRKQAQSQALVFAFLGRDHLCRLAPHVPRKACTQTGSLGAWTRGLHFRFSRTKANAPNVESTARWMDSFVTPFALDKVGKKKIRPIRPRLGRRIYDT